jgi:hypothetical protein
MKYEEIPFLSKDEIEAAILRDDPGELIFVVLSAALYAEDVEWAQSVCNRLIKHDNFNVRGNAILGFGHIARIHNQLDINVAKPAIEAALKDVSEYVRGQADCVADDVEFFLGWSINRP